MKVNGIREYCESDFIFRSQKSRGIGAEIMNYEGTCVRIASLRVRWEISHSATECHADKPSPANSGRSAKFE